MFGIVLAIIGAVTVVLSSNTSDARLSPEQLLQAISQHAFFVFSAVYLVSASILMGLSEGSAGRRCVLVDVGLCALFGAHQTAFPGFEYRMRRSGGFTVLSTKAFSTLLTTRGFDTFKVWVTYPVLVVRVRIIKGTSTYLTIPAKGFGRHWRWPDKIP
jgi:magnesium transporter